MRQLLYRDSKLKVPKKEHEEGEEVKKGSRSLKEIPSKSGVDGYNGSTRYLALEDAYVHQVYIEIAREWTSSSPVNPHIKEFLMEEFEDGSLVIDLGSGHGKYLKVNSALITLGLDRCDQWFQDNPTPGENFLVGDIMSIPMRDSLFDGILCSGVLHHISTTERRILALKEMTRIMRVGGKVLITVWAFEGRELNSQDVLIKWNSCKHSVSPRNNTSDSSETESDDGSSSTTTSNTFVNRRAAYESCNSPTSEFGSCYSFVRKALLKFNLNSGGLNHYTSRRASKTSKESQDAEDLPIEIQNLDQFKGISQTAPKSSPSSSMNNSPSYKLKRKGSLLLNRINLLGSSISGANEKSPRRHSLKENYGSFVSLISSKTSQIKEQILPSSAKLDNPDSPQPKPRRFIFGGQKEENEGKVESRNHINQFLHHRLSLPFVTSAGIKRRDPNVTSTCFEDKVCSHSIMKEAMNNLIIEEAEVLKEVPEEQLFEIEEDFKSKINDFDKKEIIHESGEETHHFDGGKNHDVIRRKRQIFGRILQKSQSSDSLSSKQSRQHSFNTESTTTFTNSTNSTSDSSKVLVAYYSMPELRSIERSSSSEDDHQNPQYPTAVRAKRYRPRITDLHPITFLEEDELNLVLSPKPELRRDDTQEQEELDNIFQSMEIVHSKFLGEAPGGRDKLQLDLEQLEGSSPPMEPLDSFDDSKKTQRSLSVEYKAKISPSYRQTLRRFSASPSLYGPKHPIIQFFQDECQHETHPSVDSEESFRDNHTCGQELQGQYRRSRRKGLRI